MIHYLKELIKRLSVSGAMVKLILVILSAKTVSLFTNLISIIVLMRYLGPERYGGYAYFTAIAAIPPLFYMAIGSVLRRFVPEIGEKEKKIRLLLGVVLCQTIIVLLITSVFSLVFYIFPHTRFWNNQLTINGIQYDWILVLLLIQLPINLISYWYREYAAAIQKIEFTQITSTAINLINLIILLWIWVSVMSVQLGLEYLLTGYIIVGTVEIILWIVMHEKWDGLQNEIKKISVTEYSHILTTTFRKYILLYDGPPLLQSIFSFAKNSFPVLFLGQVGSFAESGIFDMARKLYNLANKIVPRIFHSLLPRLVQIFHMNTERFITGFGSFSKITIFLYIFLAYALLLTHNQWLSLYGLGGRDLSPLVYIFSASLIIQGGLRVSESAILMTKSKVPLLIISISRHCVFLGLFFAYTPGLLDIATFDFIALLAAYLLSLRLSRHTIMKSLRRSTEYIAMALALIPIFVLLISHAT